MTPSIPQISRQLTQKETTFLKKLKTRTENNLNRKIKIHYFIISLVLGIAFAYFTSVTSKSFLGFVFGTLAVFSFAFIVFTPYDIYKDYKNSKRVIDKINSFLYINELKIIPVNALRIAVAKEYEDEGDLLIIEYKQDNILYLWDYEYNLKKRFPCLTFEVYEEEFFKLIGRQVNPLSERIKPVEIDEKAKWVYLKKYGGPGHLTIEKCSFDELMEKFNSVILK